MTYITLGGGPLGNLFTEVDDDVATATVQRAWDRGVRCFDTAPHYGLGLSETRIGRVVSAMPRDSFQMSTKVGRMLVESDDRCVVADSEGFSVETVLRRRWDFSAYGVRRSLDDSLVRLGLSRIDTVYIHDPDDHLDEACDQAFPALVELRDAGVIGAVGLGTNSVVVAQEFIRRCPIDVLMIAGRLTLLDQSAVDDVLSLCLDRSIAVIAAAVFNSGVLAAREPGASDSFDYAPAPEPVVAAARRIAAICAAHGTTLAAAALALPGLHPAVRSVCFGARTPAEVDANADALAAGADASLWSALVDDGLLDPRLLPGPITTESLLKGAC